ncbi:MAG: SGNH/GDSL hydrolase family protein [Acidobacteriota bacterium]
MQAPDVTVPAAGPHFERYVALGDSSTEGLEDPDGNGGYRGWANRLAERIAATQSSLLYANLGIRGRRTRQILDQQLAPALAMRPDLATLFTGTNDVVAARFDAVAIEADIDRMQRALVQIGATVLTFTLPDLTPVMPLARRLAPRIDALNAALHRVSARNGVRVVDFAADPLATDARLWSDDRLHANSAGHQRIAAALAEALALPGGDASWRAPLPHRAPLTRSQRIAIEGLWIRRHLLPWFWRHLRGRSSGDALTPKRPNLLPVEMNTPAVP